MYLRHFVLRVPFHGEVYVDIFKKVVPPLTTFNFMTQIRHWLCWLRCFPRLHMKIHSLVTTLTMRIYMKNSFITDCTDYADIQENMKNKFITEFADYLVFNTRWELISSLTTLTTQILETTCKIISPLTTLSTLIFKITWEIYFQKCVFKNVSNWLRWLHWYILYADYAIIQLYVKSNFIIDYTDYAVMKGNYW